MHRIIVQTDKDVFLARWDGDAVPRSGDVIVAGPDVSRWIVCTVEWVAHKDGLFAIAVIVTSEDTSAVPNRNR